MERPNAPTVAAFESALPNDPRSLRGQMFGHACAFANGNMYFGTFGQTLVARVGEARTATLLAAYAREAFENTATLPPKVKKAPKAKAGTSNLRAGRANEA